MSLERALLILSAWWQLIRFDLERALRIQQPLDRLPAVTCGCRRQCDVSQVVDGFVLATCLYWKRIRCLQRSVCLVRMLRHRGVAATVVIGYRPLPFMAHAWVEVDGQVRGESPAYERRLKTLLVA